VDRRRVQERIARLERDLREVRKNRGVQREGRLRRNWPVAALVGYTNAGKSSLLNCLTGAGVLAEDKLFATLDPTTRQLMLPNRQKLLLTDTVGFIRKLPHTVIESFKATLEEVQLADLLIHVVDASHPQFREQMQAVDATVAGLGADGKQTLLVFNKRDVVVSPDALDALVARHPGSVAVSARTGEGIPSLLEELELRLGSWRMRSQLRIPAAMSALVAEIHRVGHVLESVYEGEIVRIVAHLPPHLAARLEPYRDIPTETQP
jgi:GTP-binding protein HflX